MTFGTGSQALAQYLRDNWTATRSGRNDVPDVIRDSGGNPSNDPNDADAPGRILITRDRQKIATEKGVFDWLHVYHPQADGLSFDDRGYKEKNVVEGLQIDIEVTDQTDPDTGERTFAVERLVGDRDASGFPADDDPPYPGVFGETVYLLEEIRRDFQEWDVARMDVVNVFLGNSKANISVAVDLEHIAANTVV